MVVNKEEYFEDLRARLLRKHAFFGSLVHRTKMEFADPKKCPTAATNGKEIIINQSFFDSLSKDERLGIFGHEILHAVMLHPQRIFKLAGMDKQKQRIANIAADLLDNSLCTEMGLVLPNDAISHPEVTPDKYTLEQVYRFLLKQMPKNKGGQGEKPGKGEPNFQGQGYEKFIPDLLDPGDGEFGEGVSEQELQEAEQELRGIIEQAAESARMAGQGSAMLDRMIDKWKQVKIPWEVVLQDWMEKKTKNELSWKKPHRRSHILEVYLPDKTGTRMGHIGVAIDLSGSIGQKEISFFLGHMQYIFDRCLPEKVTIVTFESSICDVFVLDDLPIDVNTLKIRGGGGTDFRPVFKHFDKVSKEDDVEFEGLVFMTDLCGPFPEKHPEYPVIFLDIYGHEKAPFGEVVDGSAMLNGDN